MGLVCVHMGFLGMLNLRIEFHGESTRKCVGSKVLSGSRSLSWEGHNLTLCMSCWSGDAALTSRVRAQLRLVTNPEEMNTLPTFTFVPIQRSGGAKSQSVLCCLHLNVAEFRKLMVIVDFWTESLSSLAVILIRLFSHVCCTLCCYCGSDLSLIRKPVYLAAASCSKGFVLVPLT